MEMENSAVSVGPFVLALYVLSAWGSEEGRRSCVASDTPGFAEPDAEPVP
uniref:Uncharacterized protein n=1 Tax=uncultured organism TaxID=155900 RepID=Q0GNK4_9ZZZZ|nr:hypothetical protein [uncultured organism]